MCINHDVVDQESDIFYTRLIYYIAYDPKYTSIQTLLFIWVVY